MCRLAHPGTRSPVERGTQRYAEAASQKPETGQPVDNLRLCPMFGIMVRQSRYFRCPACGELREVQEARAAKPYLRCDDCGVQLWVRSPAGVWRFARRLLDDTGNPAPIDLPRPAPPRPRGRPRKPGPGEELET